MSLYSKQLSFQFALKCRSQPEQENKKKFNRGLKTLQ